MRTFFLGIIVALVIAAGAYYFLIYKTPAEELIWEEWGEKETKHTPANRIPEGAIMEDGTLPE